MAKKVKGMPDREIDKFTRELDRDPIMQHRDWLRKEGERLERIIEKTNPTLSEMKDVLLQKAFGMLNASSMEDDGRELLGFYLEHISPETIKRHYRRYLSRKGLNLNVYRAARMIYSRDH
jgi:hypothetical protein